jgi:hypothetical protein
MNAQLTHLRAQQHTADLGPGGQPGRARRGYALRWRRWKRTAVRGVERDHALAR